MPLPCRQQHRQHQQQHVSSTWPSTRSSSWSTSRDRSSILFSTASATAATTALLQSAASASASSSPAAAILNKLGAVTAISGALALLQSVTSSTTIGGLLAGALHAISGPDHLAALLPASVGKSGRHGLRMGAVWGVGHGIAAVAIGGAAFFLKGRLAKQFAFLEKISNLAGSVVGGSLVLIGLLGMKESLEEGAGQHSQEEEHQLESIDQSSGQGSSKGRQQSAGRANLALVANGILHGFSWDGVPSIAPAMAVKTWQAALAYLLAYALGTIVAMGSTAGAAGALSTRLGKWTDNPDLPRKLSFASSLLAVAIGFFWIAQALLGRHH
eukprot:gene9750-10785_t